MQLRFQGLQANIFKDCKPHQCEFKDCKYLKLVFQGLQANIFKDCKHLKYCYFKDCKHLGRCFKDCK